MLIPSYMHGVRTHWSVRCSDVKSSRPCCPLEVTRDWFMSFLGDGSQISLCHVTLNYFQRWIRSKDKFSAVFFLLGFLCNLVYTCWWQKTGCDAIIPTPIVFSLKQHPSKLMGCNHHHKYTATCPTARSWVFNSQSMGCKEWQAWGTQFPMSLRSLSENRKTIQKTLPFFREVKKKKITSVYSTSLGTAEVKHLSGMRDIQSILLTVFQPPISIAILRNNSHESLSVDPDRRAVWSMDYFSVYAWVFTSRLPDFWLYITEANTYVRTTLSAPAMAALQASCPSCIGVFDRML